MQRKMLVWREHMFDIVRWVYFLETRIQEPFYSFIIYIYNGFVRRRNGIQRVSNGKEYTDKVFYLIELNDTAIGLASFYDKVLGAVKYADKKNYIPVVNITDTQVLGAVKYANKKNYIPVVNITNTQSNIVDPERGGNGWEYYFSGIETDGQVYSLKDLTNAQNVVLADPSCITLYKRYSIHEIERRNKICCRIQYNKDTASYIEKAEKDLLHEDKTIGVYYRGTDYRKRGNWNPVGHPKVLGINDFWQEVQCFSKEVHCCNVFLVTEEQEAVDYILSNSSNLNVEYVRKKRFSDFDYSDSISTMTPAGVSKYENNLLYLLDVDMLSKCDFLFGAFCSGVQMALNMNGNRYEKVHIVDIGRN